MSAKKPPQAKPTRLKSTQERSPADEDAALRQMAMQFGSPGAQAFKRLAVQAPKASNAQTSEDSRIIELKGRIRADGSRVGAGLARKMTIYLPLEVAQELEMEKVQRRMDFGAIVAEALAARARKPVAAAVASKPKPAVGGKRPAKKSATKKTAKKGRAA